MKKIFKKSMGWSVEGKILIVLLVVFVGVLAAGWGAAMKLRQTVAANAAVMNIDPGALIEVERLRSLAESQVSNSRAYFLMGSKSIFDKQKEEKQDLSDSLDKFEKQYNLPQISEIVKRIKALSRQEQDIFDQGMEFREKQTESKIVGQFYQSKTIPIVAELNKNFDEVVKLHNAEIEHARERAREAGLEAQAQIPQGMMWFSQALGLLFLGMALLVARVLRVRVIHLRERDRLVDEAKKAVLSRDEVISAVSEDFKSPLLALHEAAAGMKSDDADLVKGIASEIQGVVDDIIDQKKSDMGNLTLRMDQLAIADILEEAQLMLQPLAKQRDISLQFDLVNQTVLAFVDRERVMRVLSNLVGNAIKFGRKHTKIAVKVRADQQFVNISVADGGPGVPEAQLAGLFDNYWQAKRTADQGAGVGLAVVKTIIDAHGGTIRAESNINGGTTFTFSLSRRRPPGAQIKKPTASTVRRMSRTTAPIENPDGPSL